MERVIGRGSASKIHSADHAVRKREKKKIDGQLLEGFAKDEKARPKAKQANQE